MPKPFLLKRASGLYARFLVPIDVRPLLGCRFLVRALPGRGDAARLVAARMAVALSESFKALRTGTMVNDDIKDILRRVRENGHQDLTIQQVRLPNGLTLGNLTRAIGSVLHAIAHRARRLCQAPPSVASADRICADCFQDLPLSWCDAGLTGAGYSAQSVLLAALNHLQNLRALCALRPGYEALSRESVRGLSDLQEPAFRAPSTSAPL